MLQRGNPMTYDHDLALIRERIGEGLLDAELGAFIRQTSSAQGQVDTFVATLALCGVCHGEGHYTAPCGGAHDRRAPCGRCGRRGVVVKGVPE